MYMLVHLIIEHIMMEMLHLINLPGTIQYPSLNILIYIDLYPTMYWYIYFDNMYLI